MYIKCPGRHGHLRTGSGCTCRLFGPINVTSRLVGQLVTRLINYHSSHSPPIMTIILGCMLYVYIQCIYQDACNYFFRTDFYQRCGFSYLMCIPGYYAISQRPQDGLLLIRHVNQGEPFSHSFSAYIRRYVSESSTCRLLAGLCQGLRHWLTQFFTSKPNKSTLYP